MGEQSKYFSIEPDSGIIMVANSSFLDRERQSEVSLSAVASDKAPITTRKSTAVPVSLAKPTCTTNEQNVLIKLCLLYNLPAILGSH